MILTTLTSEQSYVTCLRAAIVPVHGRSPAWASRWIYTISYFAIPGTKCQVSLSLVMFRILKRNEIWWSFLSHAWFLRLNSEIRCIIRQDSADPVRFTLQTAYKQRPAVLLLLVCVDCTFSRTSWKRQVHRHAKKVKDRGCIKPKFSDTLQDHYIKIRTHGYLQTCEGCQPCQLPCPASALEKLTKMCYPWQVNRLAPHVSDPNYNVGTANSYNPKSELRCCVS
jgi:hypothetical protein